MTTITSYATLVTALQGWLDGAESVTQSPDQMIFLAEAHFRRNILTLERETDATLSATSGELTLPTDFLEYHTAYVDSDPRSDLQLVSPGVLRSHWTPAHTGLPCECAIKNGYLLLGPAPDRTYDVILTYSRSLSGLSSSNTTNWLLEDHPDAYLYGAMMVAELYPGNDDRAALLKGAVDQIIADINAEGNRKRFGGTARMASPVVEKL